MNEVVECTSIAQVREEIDALDERIVSLLAVRGHYVMQAARFKKDSDEVKAPSRVAEVIAKVRARQGADPQVVEAVYRAMIASFIERELAEHAQLEP